MSFDHSVLFNGYSAFRLMFVTGIFMPMSLDWKIYYSSNDTLFQVKSLDSTAAN